MAEKYPWISQYAYCLNNPMRYIDPDGRQIFVPLGLNPIMMGSSSPLLGASDPIKLGGETTGRVAETGGKLPKIELNVVREEIQKIVNLIQDNPDTKINDLFKVEAAPTDALKSYVPQVVEPLIEEPKKEYIFY